MTEEERKEYEKEEKYLEATFELWRRVKNEIKLYGIEKYPSIAELKLILLAVMYRGKVIDRNMFLCCVNNCYCPCCAYYRIKSLRGTKEECRSCPIKINTGNDCLSPDSSFYLLCSLMVKGYPLRVNRKQKNEIDAKALGYCDDILEAVGKRLQTLKLPLL